MGLRSYTNPISRYREIPLGRLNGYKNAEPVSIKKIPFMESWFLGLLFENAEKAIQEGLLYDTKSNTFLERLAAGYVGKRGDGGIK